MDKSEETQQVDDGKLDDLKGDVYAEEIILSKVNDETEDKEDEDGYTIGDPYADAAKQADKILEARAKKEVKEEIRSEKKQEKKIEKE